MSSYVLFSLLSFFNFSWHLLGPTTHHLSIALIIAIEHESRFYALASMELYHGRNRFIIWTVNHVSHSHLWYTFEFHFSMTSSYRTIAHHNLINAFYINKLHKVVLIMWHVTWSIVQYDGLPSNEKWRICIESKWKPMIQLESSTSGLPSGVPRFFWDNKPR